MEKWRFVFELFAMNCFQKTEKNYAFQPVNAFDDDHFGVGFVWIYPHHLFTKICAKQFLDFRSQRQWSFDIEIASSFTTASSNLCAKYELSMAFLYWVNETCVRYVTDRQTDKYHNMTHFCWLNVFADMCGIRQESFWSVLDVNRSIFHEEVRENDFFTFSFSVTLTFDF